jgi:cytoskeletal protein CcmA (bactofilin family)
LVGPEADIKGDVTAPTIAVGAGAVLEGNYEIGQAGSHEPIRDG